MMHFQRGGWGEANVGATHVMPRAQQQNASSRVDAKTALHLRGA
jgi:hypothetical protein